MAALALLAALAAVRSPLNAGPLYGFPSGKRATTASRTSSPSAPFLAVRLDEPDKTKVVVCGPLSQPLCGTYHSCWYTNNFSFQLIAL